MVMNIRVLTPDRVICSTTADEVILPGLTGQVGVLDGHGGVIAVDFIVHHLLILLNKYLLDLYESIDINSELFIIKCSEIISQSFYEVDQLYISEYSSIPNNSGTTATILIEFGIMKMLDKKAVASI